MSTGHPRKEGRVEFRNAVQCAVAERVFREGDCITRDVIKNEIEEVYGVSLSIPSGHGPIQRAFVQGQLQNLEPVTLLFSKLADNLAQKSIAPTKSQIRKIHDGKEIHADDANHASHSPAIRGIIPRFGSGGKSERNHRFKRH